MTGFFKKSYKNTRTKPENRYTSGFLCFWLNRTVLRCSEFLSKSRNFGLKVEMKVEMKKPRFHAAQLSSSSFTYYSTFHDTS